MPINLDPKPLELQLQQQGDQTVLALSKKTPVVGQPTIQSSQPAQSKPEPGIISRLQPPTWGTWGNAKNNFAQENNRQPKDVGELLDYLKKGLDQRRANSTTNEQKVQAEIDSFRIKEMQGRYGKAQDAPQPNKFGTLVNEVRHQANIYLGVVPKAVFVAANKVGSLINDVATATWSDPNDPRVMTLLKDKTPDILQLRDILAAKGEAGREDAWKYVIYYKFIYEYGNWKKYQTDGTLPVGAASWIKNSEPFFDQFSKAKGFIPNSLADFNMKQDQFFAQPGVKEWLKTNEGANKMQADLVTSIFTAPLFGAAIESSKVVPFSKTILRKTFGFGVPREIIPVNVTNPTSPSIIEAITENAKTKIAGIDEQIDTLRKPMRYEAVPGENAAKIKNLEANKAPHQKIIDGDYSDSTKTLPQSIEQYARSTAGTMDSQNRTGLSRIVWENKEEFRRFWGRFWPGASNPEIAGQAQTIETAKAAFARDADVIAINEKASRLVSENENTFGKKYVGKFLNDKTLQSENDIIGTLAKDGIDNPTARKVSNQVMAIREQQTALQGKAITIATEHGIDPTVMPKSSGFWTEQTGLPRPGTYEPIRMSPLTRIQKGQFYDHSLFGMSDAATVSIENTIDPLMHVKAYSDNMINTVGRIAAAGSYEGVVKNTAATMSELISSGTRGGKDLAEVLNASLVYHDPFTQTSFWRNVADAKGWGAQARRLIMNPLRLGSKIQVRIQLTLNPSYGVFNYVFDEPLRLLAITGEPGTTAKAWSIVRPYAEGIKIPFAGRTMDVNFGKTFIGEFKDIALGEKVTSDNFGARIFRYIKDGMPYEHWQQNQVNILSSGIANYGFEKVYLGRLAEYIASKMNPIEASYRAFSDAGSAVAKMMGRPMTGGSMTAIVNAVVPYAPFGVSQSVATLGVLESNPTLFKAAQTYINYQIEKINENPFIKSGTPVAQLGNLTMRAWSPTANIANLFSIVKQLAREKGVEDAGEVYDGTKDSTMTATIGEAMQLQGSPFTPNWLIGTLATMIMDKGTNNQGSFELIKSINSALSYIAGKPIDVVSLGENVITKATAKGIETATGKPNELTPGAGRLASGSVDQAYSTIRKWKGADLWQNNGVVQHPDEYYIRLYTGSRAIAGITRSLFGVPITWDYAPYQDFLRAREAYFQGNSMKPKLSQNTPYAEELVDRGQKHYGLQADEARVLTATLRQGSTGKKEIDVSFSDRALVALGVPAVKGVSEKRIEDIIDSLQEDLNNNIDYGADPTPQLKFYYEIHSHPERTIERKIYFDEVAGISANDAIDKLNKLPPATRSQFIKAITNHEEYIRILQEKAKSEKWQETMRNIHSLNFKNPGPAKTVNPY